MASLSVMSLPIIFKMKTNIEEQLSSNSTSNAVTVTSSQLTKTFSKITVQNVLSENNANSLNISNNNAIVRKIKEFGMFGSLNNAAASTKRQLSDTKTSDAIKTNILLNKKQKVSKESAITPKTSKKQKLINSNAAGTPTSKPAGTPGRKGLPLPQAVARRNARERNRVKQVNNGFAALRERIPEEVAEAFEVHGSARGAAKKLSKVETLRMAVEYIRSLERLLGFDFPAVGENMLINSLCTSSSESNLQSSPDDTEHDFSLIKDEFDALSPTLDEQFEDSLSNYDVDEYLANSSGNNSETLTDNQIGEQSNQLPNITTLNGLQYIRIPGTNTYQLLTDNLFVNNSNSPSYQSVEEEQINTLIDTKCINSPNAATSILAAAEANLIAVSTISKSQTAPASTTTCNGTTGSCSMTNTTTAAFTTQTASTLSRSPVPQATSSPNATSPLLHLQQQQQQQQQQQVQEEHSKCMQPAMLSPATNELLLQTCAADRLSNNITQQQQREQLSVHIIKQEFNDSGDYISTKSMHSPTANTTLIYQSVQQQQQQQQHQNLLLNPITLAISPPLENSLGCTLPTFYSPHQNSQNIDNTCFQRIMPHKKQLNSVLLDAHTTTTDLMGDAMIESIDWWDAHTPKSDHSSNHA